jgi:antitoxin component YwqK of YwqJK toxin-antitoxin module
MGAFVALTVGTVCAAVVQIVKLVAASGRSVLFYAAGLMKASFAIFAALVVVTALPAEDDVDKQLDKLRSSIPFTAYEQKYASGQIEERGRMRFLGYVCGQAWTEYDGLREGWYASGAKECEMSYKNGKRDGVALNWFANGKRKCIVTWKNGRRDGDFTVFYDSEVISAKGRSSEEVVAQVEFFDREGKPITRDQWLEIPGNRSFWQ